LMKAHQINSN